MKATDQPVTKKFISARMARLQAGGWDKSKWIEFCERMLSEGFECYLYEARETLSKYITVTDGAKRLRIRFSNHKPNKQRELNNDCDYFVVVTNTGVRTTGDAITFVLQHFKNKTSGFTNSPKIVRG